jgi:hypothetical protein
MNKTAADIDTDKYFFSLFFHFFFSYLPFVMIRTGKLITTQSCPRISRTGNYSPETGICKRIPNATANEAGFPKDLNPPNAP